MFRRGTPTHLSLAPDSAATSAVTSAATREEVPTGDAPAHPEGTDPTELRIYALGHFRVQLPSSSGGREPAWSSTHSRTLLKYLVAAPEHRRSCEQVIELLWPEVDPDRGREYLRDTVSRLRRALEPDRKAYGLSPYVIKDRESVSLVVRGSERHVPGAWLDTRAFEALGYAALATFEHGHDLRPLAYAALALYRGPFLSLELYSDWAKCARQAGHRLWSTLVRRVAQVEYRERQFDRAILLLGQLLDVVPDDEDATQLAMLAHARIGQRGEALRLFQAFSDSLRDAYESEPTAELRALREAIRSGDALPEVLPHLE